PSDLIGAGAAWVNVLAPFSPVTDDEFLNIVPDCSPTVADRLGDDGPKGAEPPYRQRDVKYTALFATTIEVTPGNFVTDKTPATVEFVVSAGGASSTASDDQPVKSFSK